MTTRAGFRGKSTRVAKHIQKSYDLEEKCVGDLKLPWRSRLKTDRQVTGHIALAFWRGYQTGYEQAEADVKRRRQRRGGASG